MHSSVPVRVRPASAALPAACLAALLLTLAPILRVDRSFAAGTLANGSVSPGTGSTATSFLFTIDYVSTNNDDPARVWVDVGGTDEVDLLLVSGTAVDGTYQGSAFVTAGIHALTFLADVNGPLHAMLAGPTLTVTAGPTPPPTPPPAPGPTPPPTPVATPVPTAPPTPLPPGVTPRPTARPTPLPPGATPNPATPTAEASPAGSDPASSAGSTASEVPGASAGASDLPSGESPSAASGSPGPSAEPDVPGQAGGMGRLGWLVLGGATSMAGAFVLGRQWWIRRRA